jgi:integrase
MSLQLRDALKDVRLERRLEAVKKGWGGIHEWVFVSEAETPLDSSHWRSRVFKRALEQTGLRKVRVHDLRQSYATACSSRLENPWPMCGTNWAITASRSGWIFAGTWHRKETKQR